MPHGAAYRLPGTAVRPLPRRAIWS